MDKFSKSAMIALLPTSSDWCKIDLPHLTLVYAGEIDKRKLTMNDFNELAKDAASLAMMNRRVNLEVKGVEVFGTDEKVDALKFKLTSELWAMRRFVEKWNASEHPFNPHATIGPVGTTAYPIPTRVMFDRISVHYGDDSMSFWLRTI